MIHSTARASGAAGTSQVCRLMEASGSDTVWKEIRNAGCSL